MAGKRVQTKPIVQCLPRSLAQTRMFPKVFWFVMGKMGDRQVEARWGPQ